MIVGAPRDAHSEPILSKLKLHSLEDRRIHHNEHIVQKAIEGKSHPAFVDFFPTSDDGLTLIPAATRTKTGKKRFKTLGPEIYNRSKC